MIEAVDVDCPGSREAGLLQLGQSEREPRSSGYGETICMSLFRSASRYGHRFRMSIDQRHQLGCRSLSQPGN